jgi:CRP-like cAMP-binding protein
VVAATPVELIVIRQPAFDQLLATGPNIAKKLLAGMARRLRSHDANSIQ